MHLAYKSYIYMYFLRLLTQRSKILLQLYLAPCKYIYIYMCMNAFTYLHININISIYIYTCTRGHQIYKLYEYMHFLRLLTQRGKILMQLYLVPCIYVVYEYICMHDVYVCCICMYMWQDPCAPVFGTMYICCVCMFMRCEILVQLYLVPCICYATGRFGRNTQLCF